MSVAIFRVRELLHDESLAHSDEIFSLLTEAQNQIATMQTTLQGLSNRAMYGTDVADRAERPLRYVAESNQRAAEPYKIHDYNEDLA